MTIEDKPLMLADGPVLRVDVDEGQVEIRRERMRSVRTGRYRTVWSARRAGHFAWDLASTPRKAIVAATFVRDGHRPAWLARAVADVERRYPARTGRTDHD